MGDTTIMGFRPRGSMYVGTVGTAGGGGGGLDLYYGEALANGGNFFGLILGGSVNYLNSKLPELRGSTDSMKGLSLFLERWDIGENYEDWAKANAPFMSRDSRGLGMHQFCPAVGIICWPTLSVDSTTSKGFQFRNKKNDVGVTLALDINKQTYLHLTDDHERRQHSHPGQVFGMGVSLDFRFGTPGIGISKDQPLSATAKFHEVIKYLLDDLALFFAAVTSSDRLQGATQLMEDAGLRTPTSGPIKEPTVTTSLGNLYALKAAAGAITGNGHYKLFEDMTADDRTLFWWGNVGNTAFLLATGLAKDSDALLQGGLASLQSVISLTPVWQGASPEASYWIRFVAPHVMVLGGLAASGGKRQSFMHAATEGFLAPALHAGSTDGLLDSKTYSYSLYNATEQSFTNGTLSGQRSEIAIENKLKSSGLSSRAAIASPQLGAWNGNVVSTIKNVAASADVLEGNGSTYDSPTLPTTVSSMVGWRGRLGEAAYLSGAVFGGGAIDLGPQARAQLGISGYAGIGFGFGGIEFSGKKVQIGAEAFAKVAKSPESTTTDHGVALSVTIQ